MASGIGGFFGGIDGVKEDLMEFGVLGASALVGHAAAGYAFKFVSTKYPTTPGWALNLGAIALGLGAGKVVSKFDKRAGMGLAIGLVTAGLAGFVRQYAPSVPLAGTGIGDAYATRNLLMGLGDGSADQLYQRFLQGAPTQIVGTGGPFSPALNAAPVVVAETNQFQPALNGAPVVVETLNGNGLGKPGHPLFAGLGGSGRSSRSATFQ